MKQQISVLAAAAVTLLLTTASAEAQSAKAHASVIVALDADAEKVRPSQLEEFVRSALNYAHAISIEGAERTGEASVFDVAADGWYIDAVRARFARDARYRLTETSATTVHVVSALPENALPEPRTPARDIAGAELRNLLQNPGKRKLRMGRDSIDILVPERSADELSELTTAFRGVPELKVTTGPALILSLTGTGDPPEAAEPVPGSPEMDELASLSVPAHDTIRDAEGVIVRAHDPRLNDVIAAGLIEVMSAGPFKVTRLPDGATRVSGDAIRASSDEALLSAAKRRVAGLHLVAVAIHLAGAGRVGVDFISPRDAETFAHADLTRAVFELRLESTFKSGGDTVDRFIDHGDVLWLEKQPIATDVDVEGAFAVNDNYNRPAIGFKFDDDGAARLAAATAAGVGRRLGIVVDGRLLSVPVIETPITNGDGIITGDFTNDQAHALAKEIKDAAGTVPLKVVEVHARP